MYFLSQRSERLEFSIKYGPINSPPIPVDDILNVYLRVTGKFMESMFAAVSQLDNDVRSERTVAGMEKRLRQRKRLGHE